MADEKEEKKEIEPKVTEVSEKPEKVTTDVKEVSEKTEEVKKDNEEASEVPTDTKKTTEPIVEENTDTKETESAEIPEIAADEKVKVEILPHSDVKTGMLVRVHEKIKDINSKGEERERVQVFEGLVMNVRGGGPSRTITVRKNSKGWMVEKIYPLSSPNLDKIEVVKTYRVRRANLSYLKGKFKRKLKEVKISK